MTFPGVKALDNVDFTLRKGEIHALMGENGAGKSTLIKVLTGVYGKEDGDIFLDGKEGAVAIHSPQDAQNMGISTVYQEITLCPNLSVAENMYIGRSESICQNWKKMNTDADKILQSLDIPAKATQQLSTCSLAVQQMVAIARAVDTDCKVLILGMGTGTYATQCRNYFGDMEIEGVEIDEKITALAREYFALPKDVPVTTYDGRAFLNAVDGRYDVIMVDAYQDITIPFQMSSVEFFILVKEHLTEDGVMVVNMNMRGSGEGSINAHLADTISSVFDEVYTVDVKGSTNRELFASDNRQMLSNLTAHRQKIAAEDLAAMMETVEGQLTAYEAGDHIMTDDKAPVELLGMQVIDELIRDEVALYKQIYEEKGIKGVLDAL